MVGVSASADIVVVGLGAVGSAALYHAAKLGAQAIGIDRFHPPHEFGSSHGETRITRQAIGEGREYVPLVKRSDQLWDELEAATGRKLVTRNGALVLAAPHIGGQHHGSTSFLGDTAAIASENHIAHELLSSDEIRQRYPQFRIQQEETGYFEPGAGFLRPETCIEAHLSLAQDLGATLHTRETVLRLNVSGTSVQVMTDRATYAAKQAIVSAGPWMARLLPNAVTQPLRVYRQVVSWFALSRNAERYTAQNFPVFIWITGNQPSDMLYGFPLIDGLDGGLKVATELYDATVDPDHVERDVSAKEIRALYSGYIADRLPDVSSHCVHSSTCLYTVAPNARFIIDQVDDSGRILFASACSGHGFKHSAAIGEALVRRALAMKPIVNLTPFAAQ